MNELKAFLNRAELRAPEKEIIVSKRFKDSNGNVVPMRIRAVTQEENDAISKRCWKNDKTGKPQFDATDYNRRLVLAGTVFPDFKDKELCDSYGVLDPLMVPGKMLLAGEYAALVEAISDISGFGKESEIFDAAKN